MSVTFGTREIKAVADVLDRDYDTVEDAARAVLVEAERMVADRSKFVIVGQLRESQGHPVAPDSPDAVKVALGAYSTEGTAKSAADSLWSSTVSGDVFTTWVLPFFHGTPADLHSKAKAKLAKDAEKRAAKGVEDRRKANEKREAEHVRIVQRWADSCKCAHERSHHSTAARKERCMRQGCPCDHFEEVQ